MDFAEGLKQITNLADKQEYSKAIELTNTLLQIYPNTPALLIKRGIIAQLIFEKDNITLDDIKVDFTQANHFADYTNHADVELGFLEYTLDNTAMAKILFERALINAQNYMLEAFVGLAKCHIDNNELKKARLVVETARNILAQTDNERMTNEIETLHFELEDLVT
ncbi:MAG: hypothetical protein ACPG5B_11055 [Chitinophagales bacterium]